MEVLMIAATVVSAVLISSTVSRVFGKYIDLKREKIGGSSASLTNEMNTLSKELVTLKSENERLQKQLESLEATVTSDLWNVEHDATLSSKTIGKAGSGSL